MKFPIRLSVITTLFLLYTQSMPGQTVNSIWDKTFGGSSRDWNCQIVKSSDGSIFLVGDSQSDISGNKNLTLCNASVPNADIWIIKTDTAGNILWQKGLGGEADERNPQLIPLNNSSKQLFLCCHSTSDVACDKTEPNRDTVPLLSPDYWICLLDSNGNKLWDVTLGGDNYDDFTQAGIFSNGDFLVSGESNSPVGYDKSVANYSISNDLWTLRLDQNGNKLWDRVYGGTGGEFLSSVIMLPGGDFILTGTTSSDVSGDVSQPSQGSFDYWMIKVDGSGNKIWDKRFGGSGGERNLRTIQTPDNGFLMTGFTVSPQSGDVSEAPKGLQDIWIVKTDDQGNKLWDKRYGGTNLTIGTWAENAPGGGYWVLGYTDSDGILDISQASFGGSDYWVMLIDSVGNKIFDQRFGGSGNEFSSSFTLLSDSTLMLFGYADTGYSATKTDTSYGWLDYWMVKLTVGNIGTFDFDDHTQNQLSVFPNPVNSKVNIRFSTTISSDPYTLTITDISGKIIHHQKGRLLEENLLSIDMNNADAGMYIVHIESDSFSMHQRFNVLR